VISLLTGKLVNRSIPHISLHHVTRFEPITDAHFDQRHNNYHYYLVLLLLMQATNVLWRTITPETAETSHIICKPMQQYCPLLISNPGKSLKNEVKYIQQLVHRSGVFVVYRHSLCKLTCNARALSPSRAQQITNTLPAT